MRHLGSVSIEFRHGRQIYWPILPTNNADVWTAEGNGDSKQPKMFACSEKLFIMIYSNLMRSGIHLRLNNHVFPLSVCTSFSYLPVTLFPDFSHFICLFRILALILSIPCHALFAFAFSRLSAFWILLAFLLFLPLVFIHLVKRTV